MDTGHATIRRAEVLRREVYDLTQAMVKMVGMVSQKTIQSSLLKPAAWLPCGCAPPLLTLDTCGEHGLPYYRRNNAGT